MTRRMTQALLLLALVASLADCGKYGRPSRVGRHAPPPITSAAPAAEECEDDAAKGDVAPPTDSPTSPPASEPAPQEAP